MTALAIVLLAVLWGVNGVTGKLLIISSGGKTSLFILEQFLERFGKPKQTEKICCRPYTLWSGTDVHNKGSCRQIRQVVAQAAVSQTLSSTAQAVGEQIHRHE